MQTLDPEYLDLCTDNEGGAQPSKLSFIYRIRGLLSSIFCCARLGRCRAKLETTLLLPIYIVHRKCPWIGRPVIHYCERNRCLKLCSFCCCVWAIPLTIAMAIMYCIVFGIFYGLPLDNADLEKAVINLSHNNCTFTNVCVFKDWTYFVGTGLGNYLTHAGVVLEVANAEGKGMEFLQLEYGARGTYWQLSGAPQPDPRYGVTRMDKVGAIKCRYLCGRIAKSQQDPKRLLWWLDKYRNQTYNVLHYNCVNFAHMVYNFHQPDDEKCFTTAEMQDYYYNVAGR